MHPANGITKKNFHHEKATLKKTKPGQNKDCPPEPVNIWNAARRSTGYLHDHL
jgi:hypothetical protein